MIAGDVEVRILLHPTSAVLHINACACDPPVDGTEKASPDTRSYEGNEQLMAPVDADKCSSSFSLISNERQAKKLENSLVSPQAQYALVWDVQKLYGLHTRGRLIQSPHKGVRYLDECPRGHKQ